MPVHLRLTLLLACLGLVACGSTGGAAPFELDDGRIRSSPEHPRYYPFFRSVPAHEDNQRVLRYQHAQMDRVLDIALRYPNVLYTMDNETSATEEWGAYWARYVQARAEEQGVRVYTTEMWDAWDLRNEQHRRTLDHPELYAFADISQNNHNRGQEHWDNLQWVREYTRGAPRPLNHVKIYGADSGPYGSDRDAVERFWRNLIGGAASIRFHRPPSGLGLGSLAQANLRSARELLAAFDIVRAVPDAESALLRDRDANEAYLTRIEGEAYAVYFPDGGEVGLELAQEAGDFHLRWLDVSRGVWSDGGELAGGGLVSLDPPGPGHRIALLVRRPEW